MIHFLLTGFLLTPLMIPEKYQDPKREALSLDLTQHLESYPSFPFAVAASSPTPKPSPNPKISLPEQTESSVTCFAEVLYWQVIQDNLLASIKANGIQSGSISSLKWIEQHFSYDPGFKVGIGGSLALDAWKLSLVYTFLRTSSSQFSQNSQAEFYMLLSGHMQSLAEQVKGSWEMNFQALDVLLNRKFHLSSWIAIQPQIGIKGVYPRQHWHVSYVNPDLAPGEEVFLNQNISNFFWGIGPKTGIDLIWNLPKQWAISLQPSWSLLYSRIYSRVTYSNPVDSSGSTDPDKTVHGAQNMTALIPQIQLWFGVQWSHTYSNSGKIQLNLGYETQYFWNEANILAFVQLPQGNLALHGATLGMLFGF